MLDLSLSKAKAKAKVAVRNRKIAQEASDKALIERLMSKVHIPTPIAGKDGRDAPTLSEVIDSIIPILPEAKVEQTVIKESIDEDLIDKMIEAKLPEIKVEDKPAVEQITVDVSDEKLEGFVTKKDFKKALLNVQRAIQDSSGGGGGLTAPIQEAINSALLGGVQEVSYDTLIDTDGLFTYVGKATPGTAKSASLWSVKRVEDLGNGDTDIRFADGTAGFIKVWNDRTTFTY